MGQVLGTGCKVGRMFKVHDLKIHLQAVLAAATTATPSLDLWHACLGHPSYLSSIFSFSRSFRFSSVSKI